MTLKGLLPESRKGLWDCVLRSAGLQDTSFPTETTGCRGYALLVLGAQNV